MRIQMGLKYFYLFFLFLCSNSLSQLKDDTIFEFVTVPAGEFTWGQNDDTLTISYDFEIMKYEVINKEYLRYIEEAYAEVTVSLNKSRIEGEYKGDNRVEAGIYMVRSDPRWIWSRLFISRRNNSYA
jgi:formylglycine-generating enzyme required for sulfatase activity